jgi:hypothetical protein
MLSKSPIAGQSILYLIYSIVVPLAGAYVIHEIYGLYTKIWKEGLRSWLDDLFNEEKQKKSTDNEKLIN